MNSQLLSTSGLLLALVTSVVAFVSRPTTSSQETPEAHGRLSFVSAMEEVQIPALQGGQVTELNVREGDLISAGQVIGQIDDRDAIAQRDVAKAEADIAKHKSEYEAKLKFTKVAYELAARDRERKSMIEEKNAVTVTESEKAVVQAEQALFEWESAKLELEEAKLTLASKQSQVSIAQRNIDDRVIVSPVDGIVSKVENVRSEWVQQGENILTIVRLDRVRIPAYFSIHEQAPKELAGAKVRVYCQIAPGEQVPFDALPIERIQPEVETDGQYKVWIEVDNKKQVDRSGKERWVLMPGMQARVELIKE